MVLDITTITSTPVLLEPGMILVVASGGLMGERYIITGFDPQFREDIMDKNGKVERVVPDRPVATARRMINGEPGDKPIKLPFPNAEDGFEFDELIVLPDIERTLEEKDLARRER